MASAISGAAPIPPAPTQWVTDTAAFLSSQTAQSLNDKLAAYQQGSGHQVYVWIGKSTDGDPLDDWAVRAFKAWRVGRKGYDDGLVLFVMAGDRTARIEVGYGLEGQVPDAVASRIVNEALIPSIKAGNSDAAVSGAVDEVLKTLGGPSAANPTQGSIALSPFEWVLVVLGIVVLVILGFRYPVFGYYLILILSTITRRGVGSGAQGGGGRSGGGGAGGKW